jgi:prepilin-type N-terminal cleavage/methylation domain-containing protein
MRSERGYTTIELVVVIGLIGIISAIALPVFMEANARRDLWTGAEQLGASVRSARLKAITQNATYRVVFDCPGTNEVRVLTLQNDPAIDDPADFATRCGQTFDGDSGIFELPTMVAYDTGDATALQVTGRGVFTALGDAIPLTISVSKGGGIRTLRVSGTGQITFTDVQ